MYGEWQDTHMVVRYTDIDYMVFSDAASLMASGKSPFQRSQFHSSSLLGQIHLLSCRFACGFVYPRHFEASWGAREFIYDFCDGLAL
ncbi:hypothetical protein M0R45_009838 [Rubus argutus]|uniref:GPI mannosyltransferase I n=1 Tax=Rubus argutus TaxID=59490 RepID=A0AAW1Y7S7_RUBAR